MSRIITGSRRGRKLRMPTGANTRPTTDRTREALFSALTSWAGRSDAVPDEALDGLAVADLYAGSGAVGLEAASRGAGPVLLVESDRRTAALAADNARTLDLRAQVLTMRVERWVQGVADRPYDVVFADPPYDLPSVDDLVAAVVTNGWLAGDGLLVVERSVRTPPPAWPAALGERWEKTYGESMLCFAQAGPAGGIGSGP
jgi:16S rRNA (guanine966-N2)-methyltransferase